MISSSCHHQFWLLENQDVILNEVNDFILLGWDTIQSKDMVVCSSQNLKLRPGCIDLAIMVGPQFEDFP